jgi:hypothetical protein
MNPQELVGFYPRGHKELIGPFHRWQPADTIEWFESRGVKLKVEPDGRMFPVTNDSQTVVDCLQRAARLAGVEWRKKCGLNEVQRRAAGGFNLVLSDGGSMQVDKLILASGGTRAARGAKLAEALGHHPIPAVPSLFSLRCQDARLQGLAGVVKDPAIVSYAGASGRLVQCGPLLITHEGFSGPAILKLSAWGARDFAAADYTGEIWVDWTAGESAANIAATWQEQRQRNGKRQVKNQPLFGLTARCWERLVEASGIPADRRWLELKNTEAESLSAQLRQGRFQIQGKSINKDEFVSCGGIPTKEVDFRTMESKCCPGLYFAGEILNIDGVTGGFNFQAAWTTGHIAGSSAVSIQ